MKKVTVVGIGPGAYELMTKKAADALEAADVIVGYHVYVDLVKAHVPDKRLLTTPMTREVERCRMAFEEAEKGQRVAMVCSGDAGVYGMSGLMLQLAEAYPQVEVEIVSGVTAAIGGASVLGAPLVHDFAVISLSDLLTPMEKIQARLRAAAQADFVICLYNPSSKKRKGYLKMACELIGEYRSGDTVCGTVANIGREGQEMEILSLNQLAGKEVDMFTTVFVGNSQTKALGGYMVTPRGYLQREEPLEG